MFYPLAARYVISEHIKLNISLILEMQDGRHVQNPLVVQNFRVLDTFKALQTNICVRFH
jgi:hypothetical protein